MFSINKLDVPCFADSNKKYESLIRSIKTLQQFKKFINMIFNNKIHRSADGRNLNDGEKKIFLLRVGQDLDLIQEIFIDTFFKKIQEHEQENEESGNCADE